MNRFICWSVAFVALAIAAPAGATPIFLASATYSINGGAVTTYGTDGPSIAAVNVCCGPFVNGIVLHPYGGPSGVFGSRASGQGEFTANSDFSFTDVITNGFGTPASYNLNFTVDGGEVGISGLLGLLAGQAVAGEFVLDILVNSSSVFALSVETEKDGLDPVVLTESADASGLNGAATSTDGSTFFRRTWNATNFNVNLGTFGPGDSFTLSYQMSASAYTGIRIPDCNGGDGTGDGHVGATVVNTCIGAIARSGDPLTNPNNGGTGVTGTPVTAAVPEPASLTMMGLGLAGLAERIRRGRRK